MTKFTEVFPTVVLPDSMKLIFEDAMVERISMPSDHSVLRVYLHVNGIADKAAVWRLEKIIKKQLFSGQNTEVIIFERFHLSSLYTPENFMEAYRASLEEEIGRYSPALLTMFRRAKISFPEEETLQILLEDEFYVRERSHDMVRILEKVIGERAGLPVTVECDFYIPEKQKDTDRSDNAFRVENRIAEIIQQARRQEGFSDNENMTLSEKNDADKSNEKTEVKPIEESADNNLKGDKKKKKRGDKYAPGPGMLLGKSLDDDTLDICEIVSEMQTVVIHGKIMTIEEKEFTKSNSTLVTLAVTDFTDSIKVKMFMEPDVKEEIVKSLSPGVFIKVRGRVELDNYDKELVVSYLRAAKIIPDFTEKRTDKSLRKRVELHCHTKMSDMDGVSEASDLVTRAYQWGMPAIAITDHGCVQGYPDAFHTRDKLYGKACDKAKEKGEPKPDKDAFFKVIYGLEGYLVDDSRTAVTGEENRGWNDTFVVFDLETTGFSPLKNRIIEIGAVKISGGEIVDRFSEFVNPGIPIPYRITELTHIRDEDVLPAEPIELVLPRFLKFCEGCALVAHNADFDTAFIRENANRLGLPYSFTYTDTMQIARMLLPGQARHTLDAVAKTWKIVLENHHRAVDDAECTALIFQRCMTLLEERGIHDLKDLAKASACNPDIIRRMGMYHIILLAKNAMGRTNLYTLVSKSHIDYFAKKPRIPRSLLQEYREGIIVGSACEAGELYRAITDGKSEEEIVGIASFYDYLEIQPLGNNAFMLESEKFPDIQTEDDLIAINKRIVALGDMLGKPVCATCDVHFLDPEDEIYRRILMGGRGFDDSDNQAPLYLRTTDEMLREFEYLGERKAIEVVIDNTNLIADMIEPINPVRPDKCPPVIPDSDKLLTDICYRKAEELYGENIPEIVRARLDKELKSIISNGYAVMYVIAQKLVWKSVEDGYLVGSRGSVGSSLVAFMSGITEVNSLPPHYRCDVCKYVDFDSEEVRSYAGGAGADMPDKVCPVCGAPLVKDGFDIPYETFLGFDGDKEPDIDLNFSGEYQSKAHKYTEVIFGAGQTFRAGTIGTLADKTAFGYAKGYFEDRGEVRRTCEIERLAMGCTGIRRSTGQHPGGIVVLPVGENIYSFTPVQRPANDMTTETVTTHFDYHSIDHNLLKLDILGHDDPTMMRMLQDLTGIEPTSIPLDDPKVMSLFMNTEGIGITPEDIDGCPVGSMGIPEFGTDFVIQMLLDAKPTKFSDLVRISGLGHGTDVWAGNAQTLIQEGIATISTAICCRDDIMLHLIEEGMDASLSFKIMESVRKGKGLRPEWEEAMREAGLPEWYLDSCKKIKYMFPKAHAAAYVMMAIRIGYFKVYYPAEYYAAFFSIRAKAFDYETMCQGRERLDAELKRLREKTEKLTAAEKDSVRDMKLVQEMYARGLSFLPIDLYESEAKLFRVVDGKLLPPFNVIDGLGDVAAEALREAAKAGPFISRDDINARSGVGKKTLEKMDQMGLLGDIPESNQFSIFDFFVR